MSFLKLVLFLLIAVVACSKKNTNSELIALGKQLFNEKALSLNNIKSCATCHSPEFAFTDSYKKSTGIYGDNLKRNSLPLFNLHNQTFFTYADSSLHDLATQMNNPLFNQHPPELGMFNNEVLLIKRLAENEAYQSKFENLFSEKNAITISNIKKAIAAYINTLQSYESKYDMYKNGNSKALNSTELAGMQLFFSPKTNCSKCHNGADFDTPLNGNHYANTGLYNVDNKQTYPISDIGLAEKTNNNNDNGKFRIPTLRNLNFTAPYYHDGSAATLLQVIDDYNNGGRNITYGTNFGNGITNNLKSELITPLQLSDLEKQQLVQFLLSLSDSTILKK
jgi:cytochrome c peroxidase